MLNVDHLQSEEGQSTLPVMQTMLEIVRQGNLFPAFRFTWMASDGILCPWLKRGMQVGLHARFVSCWIFGNTSWYIGRARHIEANLLWLQN